MKEIVLATSNPGKIRELKDLLSGYHCHSQKDFAVDSPEETGHTFIENALLKARHACRITGKPALADDSGLVVPALHGEPGIFSARYAGANATDAENIARLTTTLQEHNIKAPQAFFYCAIALLLHAEDPMPLIACGKIAGLIIEEARGSGGFGYDPVFYIPSQNCTAAELPKDVKNQISHRGLALKELRQQLKERL